jgi:hypothetical protein
MNQPKQLLPKETEEKLLGKPQRPLLMPQT